MENMVVKIYVHCYEQKIIEKYLYKLSKEILPIDRN